VLLGSILPTTSFQGLVEPKDIMDLGQKINISNLCIKVTTTTHFKSLPTDKLP